MGNREGKVVGDWVCRTSEGDDVGEVVGNTVGVVVGNIVGSSVQSVGRYVG